ncbi:unnamed protein product [Calypogeia fissa]
MEQSRISTDFSVRPDEVIALLRLMPLLQQVPEDALKKLYETLQPVTYGPAEPIVRLNSEGAGLYIIWNGEAKVKSPPNDHPMAHKESLLKRGDYFGLGIMGPVKRKYNVDVVAVTEVLCLVLYRERADLLSLTSVWNLDTKYETPSKLEKIMQMETVGAIGDMKMKGQGFPNFYSPFMQGTKPQSAEKLMVSPNYFGGQLVAQALYAATKTVDAELLVHSLHSYFVLAADANFSVVYEVEKIRDGKSFATRHVKATQHDKIVFLLYASFQREEKGFEHSAPMPSVPGPDEVVSMEQLFDEFTIDPRLPLDRKKRFAGIKVEAVPIDVRYVTPVDKVQPMKCESRRMMWMRSRINVSEGQNFHRSVSAYATDLQFLETSLMPHLESFGRPAQILSLDHTIWFHRSFNSAEWLLFVMESPAAIDGRGLVMGKLYTQGGKLVMTVAQEGVIRLKENKIQSVSKL